VVAVIRKILSGIGALEAREKGGAQDMRRVTATFRAVGGSRNGSGNRTKRRIREEILEAHPGS
jgi:hypothetical protein